MELGKQIRKYRQEAQLSQDELANRVYVSRQTISNWENDKSYPDVNSLILLSEIFHVSLDILIKGDIDTMKEVIKQEEIKKLNAQITKTKDADEKLRLKDMVDYMRKVEMAVVRKYLPNPYLLIHAIIAF